MQRSMNCNFQMTNKTSALQQWLEKIWYQGGKGKYLLLPLSALYCTLNRLQRNLQTPTQNYLPCPVIVVGNITVGGTGKTPLTVYLVKLLQEQGFSPAIITRGYGGKALNWPQKVNAESDPKLVGDEAVLMAIRTGVPVYAGPNRIENIRQCLHDQYCNIIISDDGLQHYKLPRDIQIAVIDGERKLGNGLCLPAGPLREKKQRLQHCDFVVVNGQNFNSQNPKSNNWIEMHMQGAELINLKTGEKKALQDLAGKTVNALTGIGNPQRFYTTLEQSGLKVLSHSYPDHYQFQKRDLHLENDFPVLMTEKDAVKCKDFANKNCWYLPVEARLDTSFAKKFLAQVYFVLGDEGKLNR